MKLLQLPVKVRIIAILYLVINAVFLTAHTTTFGDCTTGDVRFTDHSDNDNEGWRQGTLQICINNAWGTMCSDNFFDSSDAQVFCEQLKGFNSSGKQTIDKFLMTIFIYTNYRSNRDASQFY